MVLSKKSWHYGLYQLMYGKRAREPKNLCPYFWKNIVWGGLWFFPLFIIAIPAMFMNLILTLIKEEDDDILYIKENGLFSPVSFGTFLIDCVLLMIYCMVAAWFSPWITTNKRGEEVMDLVHSAAVAGYIILICILIIVGCNIYRDWRWKRRIERGSKRFKPDEESIFWEVLRAWYKKNCPMIKWK